MVGALLLGVPLLMTMETWWHGEQLPPSILLGWGAGGLVLLTLAVRFAGFRKDDDGVRGPAGWAKQMASLVLQCFAAAIFTLWLFGVLRWGDPLTLVARHSLVQLIPLGLGAALANTILSGGNENDPGRGDLKQRLSLFAVGGLFIALPVAATEEVIMLASIAGWWRILALCVFSIAVVYLALFELEFRGHAGRATSDPPTHIGEALMVYWVAIVVATGLLLGFGQLEPQFWVAVQQIVVLAFPAALGGAAAQVVL